MKIVIVYVNTYNGNNYFCYYSIFRWVLMCICSLLSSRLKICDDYLTDLYFQYKYEPAAKYYTIWFYAPQWIKNIFQRKSSLPF